MAYDSEAVERYFDEFGFGEYERHDSSPEQRIKYHLHLRCLRAFVGPGARVLEIGAGPGRFTEVLAEMQCRITVVDLSSEQLRLNRERALDRGYADSVDAWLRADICDLSPLEAQRFDAIIAFGGPFSYVLDRRGRALEECVRLLEPSGRLILSVMSKWGTIHAFLHGVYDLSAEEIETVTRTGDVTIHLSCTQHMSQPPVARPRKVVYTGFGQVPADPERAAANRQRIEAVRSKTHTSVSQEPAPLGR